MTYDQYWFDDPKIAGAFLKAEKIRQERKDSDAWLQGMYFAHALEATVCNLFLDKGKTPAKYPDIPFLAEEKKQKKKNEEQEIAFAKLWMVQFCEAGKNWGKNN